LTGEFIKTLSFLFNPDFSKITPGVVITAMGQAFFTLSIGMGSIMAYGAYMPQEQMIGKTVLIVIFLDTLVALLAGFTIFPIVFSNPELSAFVGKGLLFESLPVAFHSMPLGSIFHSVFFILVSIAALSSSVSLIEPFTAWIEEERIFSRLNGVIILGVIAWLIGLGTVFSDNIWAEYEIYGMNFFEVIAILTDQFMLPLGGLLICLLVGFCIPKIDLEREIDLSRNLSNIFNICLKFVAPVSVLLIFGYALS
jgi:NSS family neurotransmitter:Na+ symporter